jgi:hypothetical protein
MARSSAPFRVGVLGWPVSHSRSPAMHNAAFAALGMDDWRYQRLPVPPALFAATTRGLGQAGLLGTPTRRGCSPRWPRWRTCSPIRERWCSARAAALGRPCGR